MAEKIEDMNRIHKLTDQLIAQVAAGEVIQEPSNIIKELLENALDAEATTIRISVEESGTKSLTVQDNGYGMEPEDIRSSWLHHTTSKLRNTSDLLKITSFGFRGEALSSIAAVADLTIRSRPATSEKGHEIVVQKQALLSDKPVGMPPGTVVRVEHVFRDIPARQKNRRSPRVILKNIQQVITDHAIAHPLVRFELVVDGKQSLLFLPTEHIEERLAFLLGEDSQPHLLPISWEHPHLHIWGYLGKPQLARRNRLQQYVAVNHRPVTHPELAQNIRLAFNTLLEPHLHPTFALFIDVPPDTVDVNIHPRKAQVKLLHQDSWLQEFQKHIFDTLQQHDVAYRHGENWSVADSSPQTEEGKILKQVVQDWQVKPPTEQDEILQAHNLYLVVPTARGVLLVDQHAAHERILYEQFTATWKSELESGATTPLAEPATIKLSLADQNLLETHQETLQAIGFVLEPLRNRHWIITSVPQLYADRDVTILLRQVLDDLESGPLGKSLHPNQHRLLSYLACRTAIKAGEPLNLQERKKLIKKLSETNTQYTCPHGRPVMVELSLDELARLFKRT